LGIPRVYVSLVVIHALILTMTSFFLIITYRRCESCIITATAFHDFLIDYKATPRSKLLRRHLPNLEAVVEEASFYEQSQQSMILESSQSLVSPTQKNTLTSIHQSEIFIYSEMADGNESEYSESDDEEGQAIF